MISTTNPTGATVTEMRDQAYHEYVMAQATYMLLLETNSWTIEELDALETKMLASQMAFLRYDELVVARASRLFEKSL